jgi:hypothetical protein
MLKGGENVVASVVTPCHEVSMFLPPFALSILPWVKSLLMAARRLDQNYATRDDYSSYTQPLIGSRFSLATHIRPPNLIDLHLWRLHIFVRHVRLSGTSFRIICTVSIKIVAD